MHVFSLAKALAGVEHDNESSGWVTNPENGELIDRMEVFGKSFQHDGIRALAQATLALEFIGSLSEEELGKRVEDYKLFGSLARPLIASEGLTDWGVMSYFYRDHSIVGFSRSNYKDSDLRHFYNMSLEDDRLLAVEDGVHYEQVSQSVKGIFERLSIAKLGIVRLTFGDRIQLEREMITCLGA